MGRMPLAPCPATCLQRHIICFQARSGLFFFIPLTLCAFRYLTAECVGSLFVGGMIGKNAPSALPCYVPPETHYLFSGTVGAAVFYSPDLCAFRYHTAGCVKSLFVSGMTGKNASSALPCYVPPATHYLFSGTIGAVVFLFP